MIFTNDTYSSKQSRDFFSGISVSPNDFIQPILITDGPQGQLPDMDGMYYDTKSSVLRQIQKDIESGVDKFILFLMKPTRRHTDEHIVLCNAIKNIKANFNVTLIVDVCLCSYTEDGECFIGLDSKINYRATFDIFSQHAVAFAEAGADIIACSSAIAGTIKHVKSALNKNALSTPIISYSAKFESSLYGGFRNASGNSKMQKRFMHQINFMSDSDFINNTQQDIQDGASAIIAKPAAYYLDVIQSLKSKFHCTFISYQVMTECIGIHLLYREGYIDKSKMFYESWIAAKRAGASKIISYYARYAQSFIRECHILRSENANLM